MKERLATHRRGRDDRWRLNKHLIPYLAANTLREITVARVKGLLKHLRERGTGKSTVRACIRLLGRFLSEKVEERLISFNPISRLDRHTRKLFKPDHDPKKTPFLRTKADIRSVYLALPDEGAAHHLRDGRAGGLTHGRDRRSPDRGRRSREPTHTRPAELRPIHHQGRRSPLDVVPGDTAYVRQSLVMDGRPIEKLRNIMGHSTVHVTERYAHLVPGAFTDADLAAVSVDLSDPKVLHMTPRSARKGPTGTMAEQRAAGGSDVSSK